MVVALPARSKLFSDAICNLVSGTSTFTYSCESARDADIFAASTWGTILVTLSPQTMSACTALVYYASMGTLIFLAEQLSPFGVSTVLERISGTHMLFATEALMCVDPEESSFS